MAEIKWRKNMEPVDFSYLYEDAGLLIDFEGDIRPKSEPYFKAYPLEDGVWQVLSDGDYTYVLEGDDELIAIDSGNGVGDLRAFCQSLCPEKPLRRLLNTHSHGDHTLNNYLFDVVYMSEDTYPDRLNQRYKDAGVPDDYPVVFLHDGDVFNLKGRPLEVYLIDEHCKGSLQFLDRKSRILFCGDELNSNFFDSRISVEHSYRNLRRWASFRDAYDTLAAGNGVHEARFVDQYLAMAEHILFEDPDCGKELYVPFEDYQNPITEHEGKPVHQRRSPNLERLVPVLQAAGYQEALDLNHGRACFCYLRKLTPDAPFDRQYEVGDARFCYFRNRIWDK